MASQGSANAGPAQIRPTPKASARSSRMSSSSDRIRPEYALLKVSVARTGALVARPIADLRKVRLPSPAIRNLGVACGADWNEPPWRVERCSRDSRPPVAFPRALWEPSASGHPETIWASLTWRGFGRAILALPWRGQRHSHRFGQLR